ncbi:GNAT family N-acetyltransferase [Sphingopyxis yananensis]|uniref:GNAT family N-acetyltransferase n=1 Tax=Sphingopyxis yananensis TaxID=2886687 RepID=UPI001D1264C6|nr:GNAT family N-acetyltransferase [Sphingopyxis yananensis]MCC2601816.1 GNAT family N-acetyltransferase [Sphingopyxis yananensis]
MTAGTGWTMREAGVEDAAALALVGAATFLESFAGVIDGDAIVGHCARHHQSDAYRALLENGARAWLIEATTGGAPLGYALVSQPDLAAAQVGDLELKRIYSLSRFHGLGMGARLMDAALGAAAGYQRLLLGVYHGNSRALAFYKKQGFTQIGSRQFQVGPRLYDDYILARPVAV